MNYNIKISVIIPVYNVSCFLGQCVESVLNQNYTNVEIILVDDGSTDDSPIICDKFAVKYPDQVRVIHKTNGGLSDARNAGISIATGDYIAFLDGDDFWSNDNALSLLSNRVQQTKSDVLNFSYTKFFEDTNKTECYFSEMFSMPTSIIEKEKQLDFIFKHNYYIASACNKLVKRSLLDDELLFEKGVFSEDIEWCAKLLCKAQSFDFIADDFYCYRQREGSISHSINDKKCNDLCSHIIKCFDMIPMANEIAQNFLSLFTAYQFGTFFVVQALAENKQTACIDTLEPYTWILSHHNGNKKLIVLNILCKLLGYKNTCGILRFFYKKRRK